MYKSLYPSLIRQLNIAGFTQIGRLIIAEQIHDNENRRHIEHWNRAMAFMEDFQCHQWLECGSRWFNLPSYENLYNHIKYLYTNVIKPTNQFGLVPQKEYQYYSPVQIRAGGYQPVIFTPVRSEALNTAIEEWRSYVAVNPNQAF